MTPRVETLRYFRCADGLASGDAIDGAYLAGGLTRNSRRVRTMPDTAKLALVRFYSFTAPVIDET